MSLRTGIYVRISDDKAEDEAGVGRQEKDCRDLAERLGWSVVKTYPENDTSAFKRKKIQLPDGSFGLRVVRPFFRQMLDDLSAGLLDAIIVYDLDRLARVPRDLEDLIDVVEMYDVQAKSVTGSLDLSSDNGIFMARILVNVANKSSSDTSRRVLRKQRDLAEAGDFAGGGIRSFGYEKDGKTVNEAEALVVQRMAADVLAKKSLSRIASELDTEGVPTVRGGAWNARSVHAVVTKPRNVALRTYQGQVVGPASWPAILDRDVWDAVIVELGTRANTSSNEIKHWLYGVLVCGHCKKRMRSKSTTGKTRVSGYWCPVRYGGCGKSSATAPPLEALVGGLIVQYLSKPDVLSDLAADSSDERTSAARVEAAADERALLELAAMFSDPAEGLTLAEYKAARTPIMARLARNREIAKRSAPSIIRTLVSSDITATWENYGARDRQEIAKIVFPDGIMVNPQDPHTKRRFQPGRFVPINWQPGP
jgi:site-specific DNA recombinase